MRNVSRPNSAWVRVGTDRDFEPGYQRWIISLGDKDDRVDRIKLNYGSNGCVGTYRASLFDKAVADHPGGVSAFPFGFDTRIAQPDLSGLNEGLSALDLCLGNLDARITRQLLSCSGVELSIRGDAAFMKGLDAKLLTPGDIGGVARLDKLRLSDGQLGSGLKHNLFVLGAVKFRDYLASAHLVSKVNRDTHDTTLNLRRENDLGRGFECCAECLVF